MIAICGILTAVVAVLLTHLTTPEYYQFCSNANNSNPDTLLPFATSQVNESFTDKDQTLVRQLVNFGPNGPCLQWFGPDHPYSLPYAPGPQPDTCSFPAFNPRFCPLQSTSVSLSPLSLSLCHGFTSHL